MKKSIEEKGGEESSESVQVLSYNIVNGTTLKYNYKDFSQKFKLANTAFNYEIGYKPADYNNDEKTL